MADHEKTSSHVGSDRGSSANEPIYERPTGFMGLYSHPKTQIVMLGLVCFMGPGLFNALNGLGGGGQVDHNTSANSNVAVYSTFAVGAFFSGSVNNRLGSRLTLQLGILGYALYVGSYLALNIHPNAKAFVIAAGAILGLCAGLLWTAQGSLMLAYPTESQKGVFIAIFWAIFNLGAVVGASVSLGENFQSKSNSVSNGTYVGFLILTLIGVAIPMLMVHPTKMIRTDGTKVTEPRHHSWSVEFKGLWMTLNTDPQILLLFPLFFASNWFYTWQFNNYNDPLFNIRARSLNNLVYWLSQMVGSITIGLLLDRKSISRRVRAFSGWGILFVLVFVVHIWAFFYQKQYTRASLPSDSPNKIDFTEGRYVGRILLYTLMGILDAMWQTTAYWLIGAMSNDAAKLAHFAGFYKSIQSAGAAGAWRVDAVNTPFMNMFICTWVLLIAGLLFALPMIQSRVKNTTDQEDEIIARMDETGHVVPVSAKN